jgi:hypothetical protein
MIEIIGETGTQEYDAACQLRDRLISEWGSRIDDTRQKITILTSAQIPGQNVRDLDLLILLRFKIPLPVMIPRSGALNLPEEVTVKSLCVVVEVKDHSPSGVQITSNGCVRVRYPDYWHDASKQNRQQVYGLLNFLKQQGFDVPFVAGVVWLRGYPQGDLPQGVHNIIGAEATWRDFLVAILEHQRPVLSDGFSTLRGERQPGSLTLIRNFFVEPIKQSTLDRRKLEAIAREGVHLAQNEATDKTQLVFRGRGGTGKTIALLHLAYDRYLRLRERTLFLTYNVALAADVERLLRILQVRDRVGDRCIRVETMLAFLSRIITQADLIGENEDFLANQERLKAAFLERLSDATWLELIREGSDLLTWNLVCVDEAQDSPEIERDILHRLFGPQCCAVADGIDQMVRLSEPCDWVPAKVRKISRTMSLEKSLRLQLNLVRFANAVARELGIDSWQLGENPDLPGGHVIVTFDSDPPGDQLFEEMSSLNLKSGNDPIDMLFCVPYSLVDRTTADSVQCFPARKLTSKGLSVWDGTHSAGREVPLLGNKMHRFVQYESCRGLEGWITFLLSLDRFHEQKQESFRSSKSELPHSEQERLARLLADEWLMIPLTRCINTLVIHLESRDSFLGKLMISVASQCKDFVELRS